MYYKVYAKGVSFGVLKRFKLSYYLTEGMLEEFQSFLEIKSEMIEHYYEVENNLIGSVNTKNIKEQRRVLYNSLFVNKVKERIVTFKESIFLAFSNVIKNKEYSSVIDYKCLLNTLEVFIYHKEISSNLKEDVVIVVDELRPHIVLNSLSYVKGFISLSENKIKETIEICQLKGITYVYTRDRLKEEEFVIVDTTNKTIHLNFSDEFKEKLLNEFLEHSKECLNANGKLTLNSYKNIELDKVKEISLYQSELAFTNEKQVLSLEEQIDHYKSLLSHFSSLKVTISLFDFSNLKIPSFVSSLDVTKLQHFGGLGKVYSKNIEAILTANKQFKNARIVIPKVENIIDYHTVKDIVNMYEKRNNLSYKVEVGVIIETEKAFENLNDFKVVDFIYVNLLELSKSVYQFEEEDYIEDYLDNVYELMDRIILFARNNKIPYRFSDDIVSNLSDFESLKDRYKENISFSKGFLKRSFKGITA